MTRHKLKSVFWRAFTPVVMVSRDILLKFRIIHHTGRQPFLLGKIKPGKDIDAFRTYLHSQGFANHFISWEDDDQIISLRRCDGLEWQHHIRFYKDGEVRGHYEYTAEAHPIWHIKEIKMESRREDFLAFLTDWIDWEN